MRTAKEVAKGWHKNKTYRAAYNALEDQFALAGALIGARAKAGLSQEDVAERMNTTKAFIVLIRINSHNVPVDHLIHQIFQ